MQNFEHIQYDPEAFFFCPMAQETMISCFKEQCQTFQHCRGAISLVVQVKCFSGVTEWHNHLSIHQFNLFERLRRFVRRKHIKTVGVCGIIPTTVCLIYSPFELYICDGVSWKSFPTFDRQVHSTECVSQSV